MLSRVLTSQLYGVSARDPFTYSAWPLLLGAVALGGELPAGPAGAPGGPDDVAEGRMTGLLQDLRYALRGLRQRPGFTAVTCSRSRSASAPTRAIFSVVNGVLLRPLPYPEPDRLVPSSARPTAAASGGR